MNSLVIIWPGRRMRAMCAPERTRADSMIVAVLFCPTANWAGCALHSVVGGGATGDGEVVEGAVGLEDAAGCP